MSDPDLRLDANALVFPLFRSVTRHEKMNLQPPYFAAVSEDLARLVFHFLVLDALHKQFLLEPLVSN